MNRDVIETLEFDKIKKILRTFTASPLGAELSERLEPVTDASLIEDELRLTSELMTYYHSGGSLDLSECAPIKQSLEKCRIEGAVIGIQELLQIQRDIKAGGRIREKLVEAPSHLARLQELAEGIPSLAGIDKAIADTISPEGEVYDSASPQLHQIRNQLKLLQRRLRTTLEKIIHSPGSNRWLQEPIITQRNGRYVIPLKAEFKGAVPGVIQDRSTSGSTIFIEPLATVELNNEITELQIEERREVLKILTRLTGLVSQQDEALVQLEELLAHFDLLNAKALFSIRVDAQSPKFSNDNLLELHEARHPLLDKRLWDRIVEAELADEVRLQEQDVVPISLRLTPQNSTLVITGPNTGGKTVTLKTVGLLSLMAHAGIPIPAKDTTLPVFQAIYTDIGDQQNLIQNLSTFSSHLLRIKDMMSGLKLPGLVLIDEIGAGTDPSEGAALGMALLDFFHRQGSLNLVTTHHNTLKTFAFLQPGMSNASMEFDEKTLKPTFRLIQGIPGRSNAFRIAEGLGLPAEVLREAEGFLGEEEFKVEEFIRRMEEELKGLEQERRELKEAKRSASEETQGRLEKLNETIATYEELIVQQKREWQGLMKRMKEETEHLVQSLKGKASEEELRRLAQQKLSRLTRELTPPPPEQPPYPISEERGKKQDSPLKKGERVRIAGLNQVGVVEEDWHKEMMSSLVAVAVRGKRLKIVRQALEFLSSEEKKDREPAARQAYSFKKKGRVVPELNLIGCSVEEALSRTDKFLDDALLAQLTTVRVIHGVGSGKLRRAISKMLEEQPYVADFRSGLSEEGGLGVTVVTLDV